MINQRIDKLRKKMIERKIDAYIIPTSDPHQSEYVADYYKTREYISGFTGSAGTVVITKDKAGLWTDGRYFIQAANQLKGTEIELYKMGEPKVPTIIEFIKSNVNEFGKIGLNGENYSYKSYLELCDKLGTRMIVTNLDYVGDIWEDRPQEPFSKGFIHEIKYGGKDAKEKIKELRSTMREKAIDYHFLGALEDICYLYNIRGGDVHCNPVLISYSLVSQNQAVLFINKDKLDEEVMKHLTESGVKVCHYHEVFDYLKEIPGKSTIYFDPSKTNINIYNSINSNVRFLMGENLTSIMKAVKNSVEIENQKNAYIKDGVALVKFFNWLEIGTPTGNVSEMSAARRLLRFREEGEGFLEMSFDSISAYGKNAALPHYSPSDDNPIWLKAKGLYLIDSGGQYLDGTTDITRTIALGELTQDEIKHYTLTLKAHIALLSARFRKGTKSSALDAIARGPIWKECIDYNHGTGHGVGYVLSVHEGPQRIANANNDVAMMEGMITSNEPGIYVEGSHGIRIENIMVCVPVATNQFGEFLGFESLSICPIDTRPVDKSMLSEEEIDWLNDYNKMCYEKLSPYLEGIELDYLENCTKGI